MLLRLIGDPMKYAAVVQPVGDQVKYTAAALLQPVMKHILQNPLAFVQLLPVAWRYVFT